MASDARAYDHLLKVLMDGTIDFLGDTVKAALVTSSYTPDLSVHTEWGDVSANEASGTGYSAGGVALTSKSITNTKLTSANPTFTTVTITFRYVVIYANVTRNGLTDPLIAYFLPDATPANIVVAATTWQLPIPAAGILSYSLA